jgi:HEAT repeat protein
LDKETVKRMRSWLGDGFTVADIARHFDVSETSVRKYLGKSLIEKATAVAKARAEAEDWEDFGDNISWPDDEEENVAIKQFEKTHTVQRLLEIVSHSKNPLLRERAAITLGRLGDRQAVRPLLRVLEDSTGPQAKIVWSLGLLGDERAVRPLINALVKFEHEKKTISATETILALSRLNSMESFPILLDLVQHEKNSPRIRLVCIALLGRLGNARATPVLLEILKKECGRVRSDLRHCILYSLGEINDERVVGPLLEILSQVDNDFKVTVIEELVRYGKVAEGPLKSLLKDIDPVIRKAVRRNLKGM